MILAVSAQHDRLRPARPAALAHRTPSGAKNEACSSMSQARGGRLLSIPVQSGRWLEVPAATIVRAIREMRWARLGPETDDDSAPDLRTQALVKRYCIIIGQDADEQVMRRRPFAAEVAQGAAGKFVTPDVRV